MGDVKNKILLIFIMQIGSAFADSTINREQDTSVNVIEKQVFELNTQNIEKDNIEIKRSKTTNSFLYAVGMRESSNRWTIVNKWGYLGRYQMSRKNIDKFLGNEITNREFLSSSELQNKCMLLLLRHNRKVLKRQIRKYSNTIVNDIVITESGILAAAHLAGAGNVRKWFRNGKNPKDKLGTSLEDYMKLFSGYNLQI